MTQIRLIPATVQHLTALRDDPAAFAALIGSPVPAGWPEFPESVEFTLTKLQDRPDEAHWWMHFFLSGDALVGSGGFVGPPHEGTVEIGYEIAPAFRGQGYATAAARAMVAKAAAAGATMVTAHTLAEDNPSTAVLRKIGFTFAGEVASEADGTVWRWELPAVTIHSPG